ncbi:imidazoleglycerol-phosphate dehydratase HisB [Magnetofaba australis]|nr:imidazoleglycerol-phosphate dehydratase HisB [Magnetofaba australis]
MQRSAEKQRKTAETEITVMWNLDGSGVGQLDTGVGFFDHMLDQIARHGLMDLSVRARGDLHIDAHHTVEDVGIAMGQAFRQAIGDRAGIQRYGHAYVPLDEALARVVVDISNRPFLHWEVNFPSQKIGDFDAELFREWFYAFAINAGVSMHVDLLRGSNSHHIAECCFKALARALRAACAIDPQRGGATPSTKGTLSA